MIFMNTHDIGALGEDIAAAYLTKHGHTVFNRNYAKKWGEIDLITLHDEMVHFVEVKTVSYGTRSTLNWAVTHETWQPEEQVHKRKLHQIEKAITTWMEERGYEGDWQIDVAAVRIVPRETFAVVNYIENIG